MCRHCKTVDRLLAARCIFRSACTWTPVLRSVTRQINYVNEVHDVLRRMLCRLQRIGAGASL